MLSKKNLLIGIAIILSGILLISCGPSTEQQASTSVVMTTAAATITPIPTSTPTSTTTPTATSTPKPISTASDTSVQVDMFRLVPSDFLSATYLDMKTIREDPDLKSVFEAGPNGFPLSGIPEDVDASLTLVLQSSVSADSTGITISAVTILRGNFDREAIPEDIPVDLAGILWAFTIAAEQIRSGNFDSEVLPEYISENLAIVSFQDYQGVGITVIELGPDLEYTSAFIDEATWVFGQEEGVKAYLDSAKGLTTAPLADLGAALPHVFFAMLGSSCEYETCTAQVMVGLVKGPEGPISTFRLYQFENAEMAADTLPEIRKDQEDGLDKISMGSVDIIVDTITQEGRFVKLEGAFPIEDLSRMFE